MPLKACRCCGLFQPTAVHACRRCGTYFYHKKTQYAPKKSKSVIHATAPRLAARLQTKSPLDGRDELREIDLREAVATRWLGLVEVFSPVRVRPSLQRVLNARSRHSDSLFKFDIVEGLLRDVGALEEVNRHVRTWIRDESDKGGPRSLEKYFTGDARHSLSWFDDKKDPAFVIEDVIINGLNV